MFPPSTKGTTHQEYANTHWQKKQKKKKKKKKAIFSTNRNRLHKHPGRTPPETAQKNNPVDNKKKI